MGQYAAYISIQVCQYLSYFTHTEKKIFFLNLFNANICMHKMNVFLISEPHCLAYNMTNSNQKCACLTQSKIYIAALNNQYSLLIF